MREAATKYTCDMPGRPAPAVHTAGGLPPGWHVFKDKDYCELHEIRITIDEIAQPVNGE